MGKSKKPSKYDVIIEFSDFHFIITKYKSTRDVCEHLIFIHALIKI